MALSAILHGTARLQRLQSYGILDTPSEARFDGLAKLAATVMRAPVALINFIDDVRTWSKAAWGCERRSTEHAHSLCANALENGDILVIPDATLSETYQQHPEVTDHRSVRFYVGIVLKTSDGLPIGTLCVSDRVGREVSASEIETLQTIAAQIMSHCESRLIEFKAEQLDSRLDTTQQHRTQFLSILAHELRAPLAPILTAVQILNRDDLATHQRSWATELIYRHVKYLGEIVDRLLSASSISFGAVEVNPVPVAVAALLEQAFSMSEPYIQSAHHTYHSAVHDEWVVADTTHSPVLLADLLTNAAKYTPDGGTIDVRVTQDDNTVQISVTDSGIGIGAQHIDEIFEMFGQSPQPLDRARGGLGLGLPLGRRLAQWQGGSLTGKSAGVGLGSEFTLTLIRAGKPEAHVVMPTVDAVAPAKLAILVVDDHVDTADALALYYEIAGHDVRVAYQASDAFNIVETFKPDVVVSDIGLPDINGYELVKELHSLASLAQTVFIAVTGYASTVDRQTALDAGFDAHFGKPLDLPALEEFMPSLLERSRLRKPS